MIVRATINDKETVDSILAEGQEYFCDGDGSIDSTPLLSSPVVWVVLHSQKMCVYGIPRGSFAAGRYEIHIATTKDCRGKDAIKAAKETMVWFFENNPQAQRLESRLPANERLHVKMFISELGWSKEHTLSNGDTIFYYENKGGI